MFLNLPKSNLIWVRFQCLPILSAYTPLRGFPGGRDGKESACNMEDLGSTPGLRRSPGEENGYPLQYSSLENSMDREAQQAIVHGVTESWT